MPTPPPVTMAILSLSNILLSSVLAGVGPRAGARDARRVRAGTAGLPAPPRAPARTTPIWWMPAGAEPRRVSRAARSEEHTSELQSLTNLVCRLLLEKKKKRKRSSPQAQTRDWRAERQCDRSRF